MSNKKTAEKRHRAEKLENRFTVAEVIQKLVRYAGLISPTARSLGCSRSALSAYLERHPTAKHCMIEARDGFIDEAEGFFVRVVRGEIDCDVKERLAAAQYILSTIGKNRGYTTKTESELSGEVHLPGFTFREKRPEDPQ